MEKWGADVLRLWVASVEYIDDVRFGPNVVEQVGSVYRNLRNRIRFMISDLDDLAADDLVAREAMEPLDRLACSVADAFAAGVQARYARFDIHDAYLQRVEFESAMSGLYFDALKDPLYSRAAGERAPAQRAVGAARTCWRAFSSRSRRCCRSPPKKRGNRCPKRCAATRRAFSISSFGAPPGKRRRTAADSRCGRRCASCARRSRRARARATSRRACTLKAPAGPLRTRSPRWAITLREALVVSQLELQKSAGQARSSKSSPADGEKCQRCWKFRELGIDPAHPTICAECAAVVNALG